MEKLWKQVYELIITGDFEVDRAALFLDHLYRNNRKLFASFIEYALRDMQERLQVTLDELAKVLDQLKALGYSWDGKTLS